jgi:hypothetical protein
MQFAKSHLRGTETPRRRGFTPFVADVSNVQASCNIVKLTAHFISLAAHRSRGLRLAGRPGGEGASANTALGFAAWVSLGRARDEY